MKKNASFLELIKTFVPQQKNVPNINVIKNFQAFSSSVMG